MTGISESFATTAFSGSMVLAIAVALLAGLVSFASPCVLPLVPGYVGYVSGMAASGTSDYGASRRQGRARTLIGVGLFVGGFTLVFVSMGVLFGVLGHWLFEWNDVIQRALGVIVVLMGLAFMGFLPWMQSDRRLQFTPAAGLWGAPVLGIVFGLGWTPCLGPTLTAINALALDGGSPVRGGVLAVAYCVGLGLPFLGIALGMQSSQKFVGFLTKHRLAIMRFGGGLLILLGIALFTGLWGQLASLMQSYIGGFETVV